MSTPLPSFRPVAAFKPTAVTIARRAAEGNPLYLSEIHVHPSGRAVGLYGRHVYTIPYHSLIELLEDHGLEDHDVELVP